MKVGAGDCESVTGVFPACYVQDYEDVFCFRSIGAVAGDDRVAVTENDVSDTEERAEETKVKRRLEKAGNGELSELHLEFVRDA